MRTCSLTNPSQLLLSFQWKNMTIAFSARKKKENTNQTDLFLPFISLCFPAHIDLNGLKATLGSWSRESNHRTEGMGWNEGSWSEATSQHSAVDVHTTLPLGKT